MRKQLIIKTLSMRLQFRTTSLLRVQLRLLPTASIRLYKWHPTCVYGSISINPAAARVARQGEIAWSVIGEAARSGMDAASAIADDESARGLNRSLARTVRDIHAASDTQADENRDTEEACDRSIDYKGDPRTVQHEVRPAELRRSRRKPNKKKIIASDGTISTRDLLLSDDDDPS
jgi:hypothetical protein